MAIIIDLDVMLAKRKVSSKDLAEAIGITPQNLSILKTGKARAVRFSTLEAICRVLDCQPGGPLAPRTGRRGLARPPKAFPTHRETSAPEPHRLPPPIRRGPGHTVFVFMVPGPFSPGRILTLR